MAQRNIITNILNIDILLALISGPVVSTLLMLIPLGILIGLFEVLDPAFVAYEYVPEEILFIPWIMILLFISFVNVRAVYLLKNLERASSSYMLETTLFYTPPEDRLDQDEYPGKLICREFQLYLMNMFPDFSCSITSHKDYGWAFTVDTDINSMIEISFSFAGINESQPNKEKYEVTIDYSPPLNPFYRISFSPNVSTYDKVHGALIKFMSKNEIELKSE